VTLPRSRRRANWQVAVDNNGRVLTPYWPPGRPGSESTDVTVCARHAVRCSAAAAEAVRPGGGDRDA
jgi:hypothetical protein